MRMLLPAVVLLAVAGPAAAQAASAVDLSPRTWPKGEYQRLMAAQDVDRTRAGHAQGRNGAVTVAYNGLAARAGLEALKRGGTAADAALTTALMQVALTAGAPVSYFGIMSFVYYDARTGQVTTMNAEWNTVRGETEPLTIPGGYDLSSREGQRGRGAPSGRTVLVGGFMKGVEEAHRRFGRLPFASLFGPSIHVARTGMPVTADLADQLAFRQADLARLPETRATFLKPDGSTYARGELFRQPALADTLEKVAAEGAGYMYGGPWGERLVRAVQADGGKLTIDDLKAYRVIWADPLVADIGRGYTLKTSPLPNAGGIALVEAQNLARAAGLDRAPHWTRSSDSLRKALDITQQFSAGFLPADMLAKIYPGMDFSPAGRLTMAHAEELWKRMQAGAKLANWTPLPDGPKHSDDVVVIDREGNIAAITHSINTIMWGKTAIAVGGISIGDPASFQQAQVAAVKPGGRLPAPTETGILFRDGKPVLGFASMGAGLHHKTFQALLNVTAFGMTVEQAINTPDFFFPRIDLKTGQLTVQVPETGFDRAILDGTGYAWKAIPNAEARLAGEGKWVAISRDPATGRLDAASHNRNNSDAFAY